MNRDEIKEKMVEALCIAKEAWKKADINSDSTSSGVMTAIIAVKIFDVLSENLRV